MSKHSNDPLAPTVTFGAAEPAAGMLPDHAVYSDDDRAADDRPKLPKGATWQDDGSVLLGLRKPVRQRSTGPAGDAETVTDLLLLHPLTGADVMRAQTSKGGLAGSMTVMLQASTCMFGPIGEDFFKRLDARDYLAAVAVIGVFTDPGR